jgi:hypothetical protein
MNMYVVFDDDSTDPTYSGVEGTLVVVSDSAIDDTAPDGIEMNSILDLVQYGKNTKKYSIEEMMNVLLIHGLLDKCVVE